MPIPARDSVGIELFGEPSRRQNLNPIPVIARLSTIAACLILLAAACSDGGEESEAGTSAAVQILPPDPEQEGSPQSSSGVQIVADADLLEGRVLNNPYEIAPGDCFNEYIVYLSEAEPEELTTVVDCTIPHYAEVYYQATHPASANEPYPDSEAMKAWAEKQCYDRFEEFVGEEYELSQLGMGFRAPALQAWNDPLLAHREVKCFVYAWRGGRVVGSVRGSGF